MEPLTVPKSGTSGETEPTLSGGFSRRTGGLSATSPVRRLALQDPGVVAAGVGVSLPSCCDLGVGGSGTNIPDGMGDLLGVPFKAYHFRP